MKSQLKKYIIFLSLVCLITMPLLANAQSLPQVRLTVPASVQAEVGKEFVIPLTITMGNQEDIIGTIRPVIEQTGIRVESRAINKILAPNSSINVALTGIAQATGLFRVTLEVDASGFLYSTDVMVDVVDPDEAEKRARFSVTQAVINPRAPESGMPFTLTIDVKNTGTEPSDLVSATIGGLGNFSVQSITNRLDLPSVAPGETGRITFMLKETEERKSGEVSLALSYGNYTQTESLFLPLPEPLEPLGPASLKIESFTLEPSQNAMFILKLAVINEGETEAVNIRVSLDAGSALFPSHGGNIRTIPTLPPGSKALIEYPVLIRGALSGHPVTIAFDFLDEENQARKSSDTIFVTSDQEPVLKVSSFAAKAASLEGTFNLTINILNTGLSIAQDIEVRFTGNQASPLGKSSLFTISDIKAGESGRITVAMETRVESEHYPIPFEISYRSATGADHKTSDTIVLSADSIGIIAQEIAGLSPVALYRYTISEDIVLTGSEFTLTLYIKNASSEPKGRTKITLGEARIANASGSAFKTPDGEVAFFTDSIPANGEIVKKIRLFADINAQESVYSLPIVIEYEDEEGKSSTINTSVSIPLRHEGKLRILPLDLAQSAVVGEAVPVSIEFANTGKVNLENVFISLEGDFEKENATFFIPSFASGTSDFFHATLFPSSEGELSGKIVITYDDLDGGEVRVEQPFSMNITAQALDAAGMPGNPNQAFAGVRRPASTPLWMYGAILASAAMVLAAIFLFLKRSKAKRIVNGIK